MISAFLLHYKWLGIKSPHSHLLYQFSHPKKSKRIFCFHWESGLPMVANGFPANILMRPESLFGKRPTRFPGWERLQVYHFTLSPKMHLSFLNETSHHIFSLTIFNRFSHVISLNLDETESRKLLMKAGPIRIPNYGRHLKSWKIGKKLQKSCPPPNFALFMAAILSHLTAQHILIIGVNNHFLDASKNLA